jgi:hypothetical protein
MAAGQAQKRAISLAAADLGRDHEIAGLSQGVAPPVRMGKA